MRREILVLFIIFICFNQIFAHGYCENRKQLGNVTYHGKTYWDNRAPKNTGVTESDIRNWANYALNLYCDRYISNGGTINGNRNSTTTFKYTNVIMENGICYQIFAFFGQYNTGCLGYVVINKFDLTLEEYFPECIWSKQYDDFGVDYFNIIQQTYEKKCNEYLAKIQ